MLPGFQTLNLGNSRHGLASKHGFGVVGWAAGIYSSYLLNCGDGCSKVLRTTAPCVLWSRHGAKLTSACVSSSRVVTTSDRDDVLVTNAVPGGADAAARASTHPEDTDRREPWWAHVRQWGGAIIACWDCAHSPCCQWGWGGQPPRRLSL